MQRLSGLLLALGLVVAASFGAAPAARASNPPPPVSATDRILGRADAPVTVIEYASFVCSHCAAFHNDVLPEFKTRFIDTGKARLVFRNLPTNPANVAFAAAALARCSAPDRYFDVTRSLFAGQAALFTGGGQAWFNDAVAASGRSREEIETCFADPATKAAIDADIDGATAAGVTGTPSFFVNGKAVADHSLAGLSAAIAAAGH
ncbi:MAG: thioredoxin domain-containing protein [Brevundimonas sp.]|uniref:thioredoxin domain-containing protein n=1 Tax=Brevundimonas sp. TaxID=1871086 RepID=UPI004033D716